MKNGEGLNLALYRIGNQAIRWIGAACLFPMAVFAFFFHAEVSMDISSMEKVTFERNSLSVYVCLLAVCTLLYFGRNVLKRIDSKKFFICMSAFFLAAGFVFVMGAGTDLRADPYEVYTAAMAFSSGDFSSMAEGGYLFHYPHQLGLVTYERLLTGLFGTPKVLFLGNLAFFILNNWMCWRIGREIFGPGRLMENTVILLSFLFLPQFFFMAFLYGLLPGFSMLFLAFYAQLLLLKTGKTRYFFVMVLAAALANLLRNNSMIGLIAMVIIFCMEGMRRKRLLLFVYGAAMIFTVMAAGKALDRWYEAESGYAVGAGEPKLLWIAMGLQENEERMDGWYNGFNWYTYEDNGCDQKVCEEIAMDSLRESAAKFKASPAYAARFFGRKTASTWCDPLFQSIWSGPLGALDQRLDNDRLRPVYENGRVHGAIRDFSGAWLAFVYAMTLIFLAAVRPRESGELLGILFFVGGFLFHLFWETKSQYVYPYVFSMIPYAAYMTRRADEVFFRKRQDILEAEGAKE